MALPPNVLQSIAHQGVDGDTLLGHLTRGDTVIPRQAPPAVHDIARQSMAAHGMDVNRFVAGAPGNHINPHTGLHEFADGGGDADSGGGGGGGDTGGGGGGGGGSNGHGGDSSAGDTGSGGGAQGGSPDNSGAGVGGDKSGGSMGSGGGAQTDSGPSTGPATDTPDTSPSNGTKSSTAAEENSAVSNTASKTGIMGALNDVGNLAQSAYTGLSNAFSGPSGKSALGALLGVDFSDLGPAGKLAMGAIPGATTLAGLNEMTAHGVDQPSNPGGNLSAADTGGVGMGAGGPSDPGASSGGASAEHPDTVQRVLNNQTIGGSNGGTSAPDKTTPGATVDPFSDLNAALNAAHGLDRSPTFTSGSDADIINSLLGQQHGQADQQLQNAHARGTLSDTGFNSAELGLGNQDQQARARLGSVSDNLLASYQQKLDAIANQAIQSASGASAANPWDITPWQTNFNNTRSDLQGRLQGDLLNLLPSGGSLYDIPALLAQGGNSQGLYNPGGSSIMQALADQRGIGTTGSF